MKMSFLLRMQSDNQYTMRCRRESWLTFYCVCRVITPIVFVVALVCLIFLLRMQSDNSLALGPRSGFASLSTAYAE